jgi:hypothetical protein
MWGQLQIIYVGVISKQYCIHQQACGCAKCPKIKINATFNNQFDKPLYPPQKMQILPHPYPYYIYIYIFRFLTLFRAPIDNNLTHTHMSPLVIFKGLITRVATITFFQNAAYANTRTIRIRIHMQKRVFYVYRYGIRRRQPY